MQFMYYVSCHQWPAIIINLMNRNRENRKEENQMDDKWKILLNKLSENSLAEAERILDEEAVAVLQRKYEEVKHTAQEIVHFLDFFISFLIDQLDSFLSKERPESQKTTRSDLLLDYQILQEAIQKSQAEVRSHIKIEHQFKIYMEGLQERIEELQKELTKAEAKSEALTEAMKAVMEEKKTLEAKLAKIEGEKCKSTNEIFTNSKIYKDAFVSWKYTGNKSKKLIEKSNDRIIKALHKKSINKRTEESFQINRTKSSHKMPNQNISNVSTNQQESFKELVQTLQMKHSKNHNGRAALLFGPERNENKLYRSNSVCH